MPSHHRRSIRLPGYDYTQPGAYFITICTFQMQNLFGDVVGEDMHLNPLGQIAHQQWLKLGQRFPHVDVSTFVIMPNHIHGIIILNDTAGRGAAELPRNNLDETNRRGAAELPRKNLDETNRRGAAELPRKNLDETNRRGAAELPRKNLDETNRSAPTSADQSPHVIPGSLGAIVRAYKSAVTVRINHLRNSNHPPIWQRNYYEHIIRDDHDWANIFAYIQSNPSRWNEDRFHP